MSFFYLFIMKLYFMNFRGVSFYLFNPSYVNIIPSSYGFESIHRTRFVRIFSRFQRVSISSFRPAVKPKPFDR
ncbi:hypothetical protein EJX01_13180 [Enterococcus faecium]|nr:hypothetical protein [Enterococcus faecium]